MPCILSSARPHLPTTFSRWQRRPDTPTVRSCSRRRPRSIVALGLFTGLNSLAGMLWGSDTKIMPSPFPNGPTDYISVGGARVYGDALGVLVALVVLLVLMSLLFRKTRVGLHMRAVADNAESATLAGVPTSRILAIGWGVAAAIGALAGVLVTPLSPQQLGLTTMFPIDRASACDAQPGFASTCSRRSVGRDAYLFSSGVSAIVTSREVAEERSRYRCRYYGRRRAGACAATSSSILHPEKNLT